MLMDTTHNIAKHPASNLPTEIAGTQNNIMF